MNKWKASPYQSFPDEWFIKEVNETTFELLQFEPFKRAKTYEQYGGIFYHFVININDYTKEQQESCVVPFGCAFDDEEVTNEFIAECMCEENIIRIPFKEYWSETVDGLNDLLELLGINFTAELNKNKRITFKEK